MYITNNFNNFNNIYLFFFIKYELTDIMFSNYTYCNYYYFLGTW